MNKNYSFMLILLSCSLAPTYTMDKPLARKNPEEQEQTATEAKKRNVQISQQFVFVPDSPELQNNLQRAKDYLLSFSTGMPLSAADYHRALTILQELRSQSVDSPAKAEAFLLSGNIVFYGWGLPQDLKKAHGFYARALNEASTPDIKEAAHFHEQISQLLLANQTTLRSRASFSQKIKQIKDRIQESSYQSNELVNVITLELIKKTYPESNTIENALLIESPGALAYITRTINTQPKFYQEGVALIKSALFANNQQLLTGMYSLAPFKNLIDSWVDIAIQDNKLHDLQMFLEAGANKQIALASAYRLGNKTVVDLIMSESSPVTPASVIAPHPGQSKFYSGRQFTFSPAPQQALAASAPTITILPNIPVNDQFLTAVKERKSTAQLIALIQAGAEINYIDELSNNPLIEAIQNKDAHLVKWLLDRGADPLLVVYDDGNLRVTPEYAARLEENADEKIIQLIEDAQVNKLKILSSPAKPAAVPASSPRKVIPIKSFDEL
jgi:hypothetical protein